MGEAGVLDFTAKPQKSQRVAELGMGEIFTAKAAKLEFWIFNHE